nr:MAG TPA: hypothetical protein [Caudoviricetes sp.]
MAYRTTKTRDEQRKRGLEYLHAGGGAAGAGGR